MLFELFEFAQLNLFYYVFLSDNKLFTIIMAIVLGGGLSGLSAAYYLTKKYSNTKLKLLLLEASKRVGGWIDSEVNPGYIFEAGPRTIRPVGAQGINTLNMIDELNLSDRVVPIKPDHPAVKTRMVYANNTLHKLPSSFMELLYTKKPFSKPLYRAIIHDWRSGKPPKLEDDTMYNFVERRFGKDLADYAISPMLCGICAGDAKEISVKFLMSHLFEVEQKHGGIVKGLFNGGFKKMNIEKSPEMSFLARKSRQEKWSIYSLEGGLEVLPKTLYETVIRNGGKIFPEHRIEELKFYNNNEKVSVKIKENYSFCGDHLVSSLPAYELARLLKKNHSELSEELANIPFVDVAVVNLQYDAKDLIKNDGFGFLVPPLENLPILGVIFDSCCFKDQKGTVLTVMMGGKWFEERFGSNPTSEHLLEVATTQLKNIMGITDKPNAFKVNILKKCIPQYIVGHHDRIKRIREYIKDKSLPISLCGSSYDGVGVNDVILSAKNAVGNFSLQ